MRILLLIFLIFLAVAGVAKAGSVLSLIGVGNPPAAGGACSTNLVFDHTVACNAIAMPLMGK